MKKFYVFLMLCLAAMTVKAQVFTENFNGTGATIGGKVEGYNNWYLSLSSSYQAVGSDGATSPIIQAGSLSYLNYVGSDLGNVAVYDPTVGYSSGERLTRQYPVYFGIPGDTLKITTTNVGDTLYAAFLINIPSSAGNKTGAFRDIFAFDGSVTSNMFRGRVFAKVSTTGKVVFGVSKNTSTPVSQTIANPSDSLTLDATYLLVMGYVVTGTANSDPILLYINPDLSKSPSIQTALISTDSQSNFSGKFGIDLCQKGIGAQIGGIRVGSSWNSVLLGTSTGPGTGVSTINQNKVIITASGKTIVTNESGKIVVYNLTGSEVLSAQTEGRLTTSLPSGLYLVHFLGIDGQVGSKKILLN